MHSLVQVEKSHSRPMPLLWQIWAHAFRCALVQKSDGQAAAGVEGPSSERVLSRMADANQRSFFVMRELLFLRFQKFRSPAWRAGTWPRNKEGGLARA